MSGNPQSLDLVCNNGQFQTVKGQAISMNTDFYMASCKNVMEPEVIREDQSDCSQGLGADGRTEDLDKITLVKVGWKFFDHFEEQYQACIDEKVYGTLWTHHTVLGKSIDYRDTASGRPSFRADSRGYSRSKQRFFTDPRLSSTTITRFVKNYLRSKILILKLFCVGLTLKTPKFLPSRLCWEQTINYPTARKSLRTQAREQITLPKAI